MKGWGLWLAQATVREMRRSQLCAWLLSVRRLAQRHSMCHGHGEKLAVSVVLPIEVKDSIDGFVGGKYVWGPITAVPWRIWWSILELMF